MFVRSLGLGLILGLAITSPARADETNEPKAPARTAWPIVLGVSSVALAATSAYFYVKWNEFQERGDELAPRIPKDQAPCDAGGDREFCSTDQKAKLASNLVIVTGLASLATLGSAIAIYAIESKPSKTAVTPVVAPGYGGAAFVTVF